MAGGEDRPVKRDIGLDGRLGRRDRLLHGRACSLERFEIGGHCLFGRKLGRRGFNDTADGKQVLEEGHPGHRGIPPAENVQVKKVPVLGLSDVRSHTRARGDEALGRERLDRLTQNGSADTQFAPKVILVREDVSGAKRAGQDAETELANDLGMKI